MFKKISLRQYLPVILIVAGINVSAQTKIENGFLLQNEQQLSTLKNQYNSGDTTITREVNILLASADKDLTVGPYSVTLHKTKLAPSGDPHDYMSQAPYWWPDPSKPDGLPYIRKDGQRNPEIRLLHDDTQLNELCTSVKKLSFAYYFTNKEQYAQKAASLMDTWFINANTKMAPNLNYAQFVPGVNNGRGTGVIESRALANIPDALAMMASSKSITDSLKTGIRTWFSEYLNWLRTSKNGNAEKAARNNHGTFYDMQVVDFALFCGDTQIAREAIQSRTIARMDVQFTTDGKQPLELARTKSWGYTNMNLSGWCELATLADHLDIDLWHTEKDGRGIKKCIEWLMPYMLKQKEWTYKQIEPFNYNETLKIYTLAESKYPDVDFNMVFKMYTEPKPWM